MYIANGMKERSERRKIIKEHIDYQESEILKNRKSYEPSKWAKDMYSQINRDSQKKGGYKPSGCFIDQLRNKQGTPKVPEHAKSELREMGYKV